MVTIMGGEWIADLGNLTCRNINNGIIVEFQKAGKTYIGKIRDMPVELLDQWAQLRHGERLIYKTIKEAEDEFLRAYVVSKMEKKAHLHKGAIYEKS